MGGNIKRRQKTSGNQLSIHRYVASPSPKETKNKNQTTNSRKKKKKKKKKKKRERRRRESEREKKKKVIKRQKQKKIGDTTFLTASAGTNSSYFTLDNNQILPLKNKALNTGITKLSSNPHKSIASANPATNPVNPHNSQSANLLVDRVQLTLPSRVNEKSKIESLDQ